MYFFLIQFRIKTADCKRNGQRSRDDVRPFMSDTAPLAVHLLCLLLHFALNGPRIFISTLLLAIPFLKSILRTRGKNASQTLLSRKQQPEPEPRKKNATVSADGQSVPAAADVSREVMSGEIRIAFLGKKRS